MSGLSFVPTCFGHLMKSALCLCLRIIDRELSLMGNHTPGSRAATPVATRRSAS